MDANDLQDVEVWDFEAGERREPVRGRRSVVSVAISPQDLATIAQAARDAGKKLSEFIREAALEKATGGDRVANTVVFTTGGPGQVAMYTDIHLSPITRVALPVEETIEGPVYAVQT
jgi:hypothetical protein